MIRRALAFQQMGDEPPGLFREFLNAAGYSLDVVMLHKGQAIPSLAPYDFLLVMGGAMDVWEDAQYPWLADEKAAIREWAVNRNRPYFGVCLGLQLLAVALGGKVGLARAAEVGIGAVKLTGSHPLVKGLPQNFRMMQWHHAEVTELPQGAEALASSEISAVQIMTAGDVLVGTQFHGELTPCLVERWGRIPQYIDWLEQALGVGAYERVKADAMPQMARMRSISETMFANVIARHTMRRAA